MQRIPLEEVVFHPVSVDPNGRLFWWEGQLYRGIPATGVALYQRLFAEGIVQRLVDKGLLIETELTSFETDCYPLILKHRALPFVSYPYEWCAAMLKDAALTLIDLESELAPHHLTLQDAHPWNVLFDGYKPVFVDFSSIRTTPDTGLWSPYDEFCRFFIYPLHLMALGYGRVARWLLHDFDQGVLRSDFQAMVYGVWGFRARSIASQILRATKKYVPYPLRCLWTGKIRFKSGFAESQPTVHSRLSFLRGVRREVESITLPSPKTEWSNYYDDCFPTLQRSENWTAKHLSVEQVLSELRPATVLDIGSNRGWYAQLATQYAGGVVGFDVDEECVARLYGDAKEKELKILPLMMNFRNPSPGYGLCNQWLSPATQRFPCELVFALALVHHLVFKQWLSFNQIAEGLSAFTRRWLLVEFIPREDRYVREWWSEDYSWYTVDNFITALSKDFHNIKAYPSYPAPRILLLCEKQPGN